MPFAAWTYAANDNYHFTYLFCFWDITSLELSVIGASFASAFSRDSRGLIVIRNVVLYLGFVEGRPSI